MRAALVALLFVVACKEESKPAPAAAKDTPVSAEKQARQRPQLEGGGERAEGSDESTEDPVQRWDRRDPALREEIREKIEERRRKREEQLDTNHDGVVSPEERQARLKPMVERLDANGDGKLTPDELSQSDRRMGFDDPAAVDTNKDGEISLGELDAAMSARREKMRERWRGGGPPHVPGSEP